MPGASQQITNTPATFQAQRQMTREGLIRQLGREPSVEPLDQMIARSRNAFNKGLVCAAPCPFLR